MKTKTLMALTALALLDGCARRPPAAPAPDPMVEYLNSRPKFQYRQSTLMTRARADKCLAALGPASTQREDRSCEYTVAAAEASEEYERSLYEFDLLTHAPRSASGAGYYVPPVSTAPATPGPTIYLEPRPGTSITTFDGGAWSSQQNGTFCTGGNGTVWCQ